MISIIIPIYNVEKYLSKCIESLVGQTYKDIEIILINDGSPDHCLSICEQYSKKIIVSLLLIRRIKVYLLQEMPV